MKPNVFHGNLVVEKNQTLVVDYTEITGYVSVYSGATLQADQLDTVGRDVYVRSGATFQANKLATVGGDVSVYSGATLQADQLDTVGRDVYVRSGATFQADQLATVGGDVSVYSDATFQANKLATVGGDVSVYSGATLQADQLDTVGRDVYVRSGATFQADQLATVGGYVSVHDGATYSPKNAIQDSEKAKEICSKIQRNGFITPDEKHIIADGILTEIVDHRNNVYRVRKIAQKEIEYLITDGNGNWAHGATLDEAKEDLLYKVTDRKKSDYEHLKISDTLSHADAVRCYRVVTGARSAGTRYFIEQKLNGNRKESYTIAEIIELTKGEYGNNTFSEFFTKNQPQ